tara:strand:+ start:117 stop:368 length:252 start_codon:yes stop_codon:yes gene_type:complete
MNGFTSDQLTLLHEGGYLHNQPESPNLLPRHLRPAETEYPVEAHVRSFLAVNCASWRASASLWVSGFWVYTCLPNSIAAIEAG